MKKGFIFFHFISLSFLLCGCSFSTTPINNGGDSTDNTNEDDTDYDDVDSDVDDDDYDGDEATADFTITTSDGTYTNEENIYYINESGTYTLSGKLEGQIYIAVPASETEEENEVDLELNDVSISYDLNSPIYCPDGDKLKIKSISDTFNTITDNRTLKTSDVDTQGEGAIYAKCDLSLTGQGTLVVVGNYNNGIQTTKDLKIKNVTLKSTAPNNSIKGNDSIEIESGSILAVSSNGDGLKTENTDISSSTGKQRGTISIYGGSIDIYAAYDAIDAAYNVEISNGTDDDDNITIPVINAYTNQYSDYSQEGDSDTSDTTTSYISIRNNYSVSYRYALYWYNPEDSLDYEWTNCTYISSYNRMGSSSTYYAYRFLRPSEYTSFYIYRFAASDSTNSTTTASASTSEGVTWNSNYDTYIVSISGSTISPYASSGSSSWGNYSSLTANTGGGGFSGGDSGNTETSTDSAKGIKADNTITISGGKLYFKAYDDGIHANYGTSFDNGSSGLGDITISGGDISIYAADDGMHADRYLNITGGTINVISSYEGLEANVIQMTGGTSTIYATNDGVNASLGQSGAGLSIQIIISGGLLDVSIASGDTDGIDSNGSFTQSGGIVISRGSPNTSSNMSTGLDCDGSAKITGGTLLCFGKPEVTPNYSGSVSYKLISGTYGSGTYTIGGLDITTKNIGSYNGAYIYSDQANSITITSA